MYKIVRITDKNDIDKSNDPKVAARVGRVIDDVQSLIAVGSPGFLYCTYPDYFKSLYTTRIERVISYNDEMKIYTKNSIYYLKRVGKRIKEEK